MEALLDVAQGKLTLKAMNEQVTIDVFRAIKHLYGGNTCFCVDAIGQLVDEFKDDFKDEPKNHCKSHFKGAEYQMSGYEQHVLSLEWSDDEDGHDALNELKEEEYVKGDALLDMVENSSSDEMR